MKNKILILLAAAVLVAGGLTTNRLLAADDAAPGWGQGKLLKRIADQLGLTSDQRTRIMELISADKSTLQPILSRLHSARQHLRECIRASDASEASVRAAAAQAAAAEADLAVERMKLYAKIAPILTGEQQQKIADFEEHTDNLVDQAIARIGSDPGN